MKKLFKCIVLLTMLLSGCSSSSTVGTSTTSWTNGTYTSSANGYGGTFDVSVTLDDTGIKDILVGDNNETESIGAKALPTLVDDVIKNQSIAIDGVSGATVTTTAFLDAVTNCLEQANADLSLFNKEIEQTNGEEIVLDKTVVVVGAGAAGISAALRLNQLGISDIIVLEKMAYVGGASATCGGGFLVAGSKYQDIDVTDETYETMVTYLLDHGHNVNDVELTKLHSNNAANTVDWLIDDYSIEFSIPESDETVVDFVATDGGAGFMKAMENCAKDAGIEILTDTQATELISNNGSITGIKALDTKGNSYTINTNYVVLASGGYGNNHELVEQANVGRVIYYGPAGSNGDGLLMAQALGAKVTNLEYVGVKPNGLETSPGVGKYTQPANNAMWKASAGILVNDKGERLISETSSEYDLVQVYKQQNDWAMYTVMDQASFDVFYSTGIEKNLFSEADVNKWLEEKGTGTTIFVKGSDITEAANLAGIDGVTLTKTIEKYNEGFENGVDDFGRNIVAKFDTNGPIYIVKQNLRFATTLGGLDINTDCQVLLEDDSPIVGLYAAGEIVGNVQGDASTGYLSWAATNGKLAAESIVNALNK